MKTYKERFKEKSKEARKLKSQLKRLKTETRKQLRGLKEESRKQMVTLITSAFSFVAALFWRDAVQALISQNLNVKRGEGPWEMQMGIAFLVTIIAIIAIFFVSRTFKPQNTENNNGK